MAAYTVNGTDYEHDEEGYIIDVNTWNEDLGKVIADAEGLNMTDEHWDVVKFLREYYNE
ncbi:MAG TPA: TusE/DsrC/DsvC family sulfur relay protein, partial [Magnetovibrio sp.]